MIVKTKTDIKFLSSITPKNVGSNGGHLKYTREKLVADINNKKLENYYTEKLLSSKNDSIEEVEFSKKLLELSYLSSVKKLLSSNNDSMTRKRAKRLTRQSVSLYGDQDIEETLDVMKVDMNVFESLLANSNYDQKEIKYLIKTYESLGVKPISKSSSKKYSSILSNEDRIFKSYIESKFEGITKHFDDSSFYSPEDIIKIIRKIIKEQSKSDISWKDWTVEAKKDGSMSVDCKSKKIKIGLRRAQTIGYEAKASVVHELASHVQRSINGTKTMDKNLELGLEGFQKFEEGLGCYMEYVITGDVPLKITNRQITASLALGQFDKGKQYDRNEIFKILKSRTRILLEAKGVKNEKIIEAKTKELRTLVIDRFFRGGRGVRPGLSVFTKDVVYAKGFKMVKKYINKKVSPTANNEAFFDYIMSGKFDPLNSKHVEYLQTVGLIAEIPCHDLADNGIYKFVIQNKELYYCAND